MVRMDMRDCNDVAFHRDLPASRMMRMDLSLPRFLGDTALALGDFLPPTVLSISSAPG
jgi:hypothetical protein